MFNIVEKRYWFFSLSALVIIPGLIAMAVSIAQFGTPLKLSIDFTGGALQELRFEQPVEPAQVRQVFIDQGYGDTSVQSTNDQRTVLIRSKFLDEQAKAQLQSDLRQQIGPFEELSFQAVGPTIGGEVTRAATIAVLAASVVILA